MGESLMLADRCPWQRRRWSRAYAQLCTEGVAPRRSRPPRSRDRTDREAARVAPDALVLRRRQLDQPAAVRGAALTHEPDQRVVVLRVATPPDVLVNRAERRLVAADPLVDVRRHPAHSIGRPAAAATASSARSSRSSPPLSTSAACSTRSTSSAGVEPAPARTRRVASARRATDPRRAARSPRPCTSAGCRRERAGRAARRTTAPARCRAGCLRSTSSSVPSARSSRGGACPAASRRTSTPRSRARTRA